jgi:MFS family permease
VDVESRKKRWWIIALLCFAALVNYVDRNNLSVAVVPVMGEFDFSPAVAGTLMSAFYWTYTLLQIPSGWAVDRFGLRLTYGLSFLVWSLSSAAIGLARSFSQILVLRLILGLGEAAVQPVSLTYIRTNFDEEEQGFPTAAYILGMMIGPAVGGFLGGALLEQFGWRQLLILTGLIPCVWLAPWFLLAPAGRAKLTSHDRPPSAKVPLRKLFANPAVWGITITAFFYSYFWYFIMSWLPAYLVMERGMSFLDMGIYTALPFLAMAVVAPSAGHLADRWARRTGRPVFVRKIFVISGYLLGSSTLLLIWTESAQIASAILIFALASIGLTSANYWAVTQAISPRAFIGRAIGYQNTISNLAGICAPVLTGILVGESKNFSSSIAFAAVSLWIAAASYAFLVRESSANEIKGLFAGTQGPTSN